MTIKTDYSRFHIHDELTAPARSAPLLEVISKAGSVPKFVGALAGAPAALRAFARFRSELKAGILPDATRERIGLAVAERRGDNYGVAQAARTARTVGLGLDEISQARSFRSGDPRENALLVLIEAAVQSDGHVPNHLLEEAREADWSDEEILEALAHVALVELQSLVANVGGLPNDQIDSRVLPSAAAA